jgi:hypothetical protein
MSDLVGRIMAYESGELDDTETLELFSELIKSGTIRHLQGAYGRAASDMIADGLLTPEGDIAVVPDE